MAVMIDKETKEAVPVTAFLHGDQLAKDIAKVNDASRGKFLTVFGMSGYATGILPFALDGFVVSVTLSSLRRCMGSEMSFPTLSFGPGRS